VTYFNPARSDRFHYGAAMDCFCHAACERRPRPPELSSARREKVAGKHHPYAVHERIQHARVSDPESVQAEALIRYGTLPSM